MSMLCYLLLRALLVRAGEPAPDARLYVAKNADGQLEVFDVDQHGELRHRWQKPSTGDWSGWSSLGGSVLPDIAIANGPDGRIEVFAIDNVSQSLEFVEQQAPNGRDWSGWRRLGGRLELPLAVGQNAEGALEVFARDADTHQIKYIWQTNSYEQDWSEWSDIPAVVGDAMLVERNTNGCLELFAIESGGKTLGHCWQRSSNNSESWSKWATLGGSVLTGMAAGQNEAGQLEIFAVNATNGAVNRIIQTNASDSASWSDWVDFDGDMKTGLAVGQSKDRRLEILAVDAVSGMLMHRWETLTNGSDRWSGWAGLTNNGLGDARVGALARPYPAVTANDDGNLEVFAIDPDQRGVINHRQQISKASDWLDWSSLDNPTFQYSSRTWHSDEGLPDNLVQAITQTPDGYLWVGTRSGLAQFDGQQFTVYDSKNTPQLKNPSITALCADHNGTLWIGTDGGGMLSYRDGVFRALTTSNGLAGDAVRVIFEGKDYSLWIGTTTGMSEYKEGHFRNYSRADGLMSDVINYIYEDRGTNLWIATGQGLNRLREGGAMDQFPMPSGLPNDSVRGICQDKGGRVWIGSNNGLLWYNWYWQKDFYPYNTRYGLSDTFVSAICEDREGNLWVGTYSGLNRFRNGRFLNQLDNEGAPFDHVNALFEDREGDLWVGSKEGLIRLTPKRFTTYTKQQGLTHNNAMSVVEDRGGSIWIGTWGGGLDQLKDERVIPWHGGSTNVSQDLILSLCTGRDGSIWAGADFDGGLMRLKDGKITHYGTNDGLIDAGIRVLCEDRDGKLWIGTSRGLSCFSDGRFSNDTHDGVRAIREDHAGDLWFGTENGLERRQNGNWTRFTHQDGLSGDNVTAIYEDRDHVLWVGTANGGLNRLRDNRFTSYTTRQGLFSDEIFSIVEDDQGWLWMSCSKGVFRVRKKDIDDYDAHRIDKISSIAYGKNDGMESPQCNGAGKPAVWKSRDGRLWFPTSKGVASVDPRTIKDDHLPPPVYIEQLTVDNKPVALPQHASEEDPLRVGPGPGDMEFRFAALSLAAPEKNRFKYKLENVDADWKDSESHVVHYNNIAPGHYRFQVIACNKDGLWNSIGATLDFTFRPHYWQTWWFRGLLAVLVIGGASGTALYATRRKMQRQLQLLEQRHAIEKERGRIAKDIHDDLGSSLTRIMMLGERVEEELGSREDIGPHISKIVSSARHTVQSLDEIVWAVNPENDTLNGLLAYIGHYADEFFENTPVNCRLELPVELPAFNLPAEARHNLFLMVKEAFNNALKHSGATEVRVEVSVKGEILRILVHDNGRGFDPHALNGGRKGNGLGNMRKRMENLGGEFEMVSAPGKGTTLKFMLRLQASAHSRPVA